MFWLLYFIGAVLLLVIVSGIYVFIAACVRRKELPWLVEEEINKTSYVKYYHLMADADKWLKGHQVEDVYITSDDGLKLHALLIPADNPKGTMLFAHGYRSTILLDFGLVFEFYRNQGMNLLVPDQRCHGKSEGTFITFGVKESRDMKNWIDFHNKTFGNYPIVLSGLSMGASTMMYLADQQLPNNVKGIIADCGFTSPRAILDTVFRSVIHLPSGPTLFITDVLTRFIAGFSLDEKDSRDILTNCKLPIFMVHGEKDGFVPCSMTHDGFAACREPKKLLLVKEADHGVSFLVDKERYINMILEFLSEIIN